LSSDDGCAVLKVADTGSGIREQDFERIVDRFYSGARSDAPGTGFGLAIAKRIVEAQGGTIEVKSGANKGSTFTVWLPLAKDAARHCTT
jgi:signal transduction histidine kinase